MVQEIWQKLNANERLAAIGAIVVLIAWLVGIVSAYGIGAGTISFLGAIAVLAIYYLKYAPNQNINWPAPIPTIVLGISAIVALLALLDGLRLLSILSLLSVTATLAVVGTVVGALIMVWGAWQEYQAMPKTTPPAPPTPPTPPA
jgi:hypothetical protein